MADIFAPTESSSGLGALANPTARASANPNRPFDKKAAKTAVRAGPLQAPIPRTFFDTISQFLFGAPEFNQSMQARQQAGLASADDAIARMRANNAAVAQRLAGMKLGAEALDAAPAPAKPMDPLALFGGPTPQPPRSLTPGQAPTPQAFMAAHNAQTPMRPQAAAPAPMAPMQQAMAPQRPSLVFSPPGAPPPATAPMPEGQNPKERWAKGLGDIASALGGEGAYAPAPQMQPRPVVPPIGQRKYF